MNIGSLVVLSDLHVKADAGSKENRNAALAVSAIIGGFDPERAAVLILGDLVDRGFEDSHWSQLDSILAPLDSAGFSVICPPGNHDTSEYGIGFHRLAWDKWSSRFGNVAVGQSLYGGACETWRGRRVYPWDLMYTVPLVAPSDYSAGLSLAVLSSVSVGEDGRFFACGQVGDYQLSVLDAVLDKARDDNVRFGIVLHHHLYDPNPFEVLDDVRQLVDGVLSRRAAQVAFVANGHRHVEGRYTISPRDGSRIGVPVYAMPKTTADRRFHVIEVDGTGKGEVVSIVTF